MEDYRTCKVCGQTFRLTSEYFKPHANTNGKKYFPLFCRQCGREKEREYRAKPKSKALKAASRKRRDPAVVAAEKKRSHERNRQNDLARSKRWREQNIEHAKDLDRKNYLANRERRIAQAEVHTIKRMARKRSLPDTFTPEQWNNCLSYFNDCCAVCGRPRGLWHTIAMDHWIPLADPCCPGTVAINIIPLCHGQNGCNNSKGDHPPLEWLTDHFGAKKATAIAARIKLYFESVG